jgi:hypothetical protein
MEDSKKVSTKVDKTLDNIQNKIIDFKNLNRGLHMKILSKENNDIKNLISNIIKTESFIGTKKLNLDLANINNIDEGNPTNNSLKRKKHQSSKQLKGLVNKSEESNNSEEAVKFPTYAHNKPKRVDSKNIGLTGAIKRRSTKPSMKPPDQIEKNGGNGEAFTSPFYYGRPGSKFLGPSYTEKRRSLVSEHFSPKRSPTNPFMFPNGDSGKKDIFKLIANEIEEPDSDYFRAKTNAHNMSPIKYRGKMLPRSRTTSNNPFNNPNTSSNTLSFYRSDTFNTVSSLILDANTKDQFRAMAVGLKRSLQVNYTSSDEDDDDDDKSQESMEKKQKEAIKREKSRKLSRQKLVYDSFSDEEVDEDADPYLNIHPNSRFRQVIEIITLVGTAYSLTICPIHLAYHIYGSLFFLIIDLIFDINHMIDLLTSFITGYHDVEENIVNKTSKTVKNYLSTWFVMDLICCIPMNSYNSYLFYFNKNNSDFHIPELLIILRCFKLFKVILHNTNIINISLLYEISKLRRFLFATLVFVLVIHTISCIYIFLGHLDTPNWMTQFGMIDSDPADVYIASFYFICSTIFTIGYGDLLSVSIYERTYNVLLLMIGIMLYSYAISSLSNYVQESDEKTQKYERSMELLQQMKIKYSLKESTFMKISRFLRYEYKINKIDNNTLLSELPISIRNEIMYHMYRDLIDSFIFFKNFDNLDFINRVLLTLKPIKGIRNEILLKEGDLVEETIFVRRGILSLEVNINLTQMNKTKEENDKKKGVVKKSRILQKLDQQKTGKKQNKAPTDEGKIDYDSQYIPEDIRILKIIQIRKNEHFGDVLMFLNQPSPLTLRVKTKFAELFLMHKIDLANIARDFPDIFRKIYSKSVYNMDKIQSLIATAKALFFHDQSQNIFGDDRSQKELMYSRTSSMLNFDHPGEEKELIDTNHPLNKTDNSELTPIYENRGYSYKKGRAGSGKQVSEYEIGEDDPMWLSNKSLPRMNKPKEYSDEVSSSDTECGHGIGIEKNIFEDIRLIPSNITHVYYKKDNSMLSSRSNISLKGSINEEKSKETILPDKWKHKKANEQATHDIIKKNIESFFKKQKESSKIINNGNINIINNPVIHRKDSFSYRQMLSLIWANSKISNQISFCIESTQSKEQKQRKESKESKEIKEFGILQRSETRGFMKSVGKKVRFESLSPSKLKRSLSVNSNNNFQRMNSDATSMLSEQSDGRINVLGTKEQLFYEERGFFKSALSMGNKAKTRSSVDIAATNISSSIMDANRIEKRFRQKQMLNAIHENIVNSNLNINDPESYYKKWLIEIHNKRLEKNKKNQQNMDYDKLTRRLEKLEDIIKVKK